MSVDQKALTFENGHDILSISIQFELDLFTL